MTNHDQSEIESKLEHKTCFKPQIFLPLRGTQISMLIQRESQPTNQTNGARTQLNPFH